MGLDIRLSKGDQYVSMSYGSFHNFRKYLMKEIFDENLDEMIGFGELADKKWTKKHYPLSILLAHSDCDGSISPKELAKLIPAIKEKLPIIENIGYYNRLLAFVKLGEQGIEKNQGMRFR